MIYFAFFIFNILPLIFTTVIEDGVIRSVPDNFINRVIDIRQKRQTSTCKTTSEFRCKSGMCISRYSICDGTKECDDGSDETAEQCGENQCQSYTFRCNYGACIPNTNRCDNIVQCADGSDESPLICRSETVPIPARPGSTSTTTRRPTTRTTSTTTQRYTTEDGCQIPEDTPGRRYTIGCESGKQSEVCNAQPGDFVPLYTLITIRCDEGYIYNENIGPQSICTSNSWLPPIDKCSKLCKRLNPVNAELSCTYQGQLTNCNNNIRPGTIVVPSCLPIYQYETNPDYGVIVCQENGEWDHNLVKCVPECGLPHNPGVVQSIGGRNVSISDSPWHVALYDIKTYTLICGGTIVSPNMVVSAAHCVFDKNRKALRIAGDFELMVSKVSRNYTITDNDDTQVYKIKQMHFHPQGYRGELTNHVFDIVVFETVVKITLKPTVRTACVEWTRRTRFNPPHGTPGKVVGWGIDESGNAAGSQTLLAVTLPFVSYERCIELLKNYARIVTADKFCAGDISGAGVTQGDSGGGLMFPKNEVYYLYGVVSIKPDSANISIAAFTDITQHLEWISKLKSEIERQIIQRDTTLPVKTGP